MFKIPSKQLHPSLTFLFSQLKDNKDNFERFKKIYNGDYIFDLKTEEDFILLFVFNTKLSVDNQPLEVEHIVRCCLSTVDYKSVIECLDGEIFKKSKFIMKVEESECQLTQFGNRSKCTLIHYISIANSLYETFDQSLRNVTTDNPLQTALIELDKAMEELELI